jgi:hypothetical protein
MIEYDQIKKDNIHFTHWRWENDCEREEWGQRKLNDQEAMAMFQQLKASGWLRKQSQPQNADDPERIDLN